MSSTSILASHPPRGAAIARAAQAAQPGSSSVQRIPGAFQLILALYILLTGDLSTIVQALAFGLEGGAESEFAAAMVMSLARDLLLLAPVLVLASHPLGVLHPLLIAVIVWPILIAMPDVIEEFGGWAGVITGVPLEAPVFIGLPLRDAPAIWTAIAKYSGIEILSILSIYAGFWLFRARGDLIRIPSTVSDPAAFRNILIGILAFSVIVLIAFVYWRGGLGYHVTSLGRGRFRELAGTGHIIVLTDLGAIALYLWVAARPGDVKLPLFIVSLATVIACQFISNGSRGSALMVPMMVGLIWSLRRQRVPWKLGLLFLPLMFASIGLLGAVRTSSWYGSTAQEAWSSTGWAESVQIAQQELQQRRAVSAHVPVVERGFEVTGGPMYGQTYVAALAAWIPRAIWEEKPRGTGSIYAQLFLNASKEGVGIPVSAQAEMFWNFGLPGVILLSMIYGALIKLAYNFMSRRYPNPFAIVFYIIFLTSFEIASRPLVGFQQRVGLLLVCYAIAAFLLPHLLKRPRAWGGGNARASTVGTTA